MNSLQKKIYSVIKAIVEIDDFENYDGNSDTDKFFRIAERTPLPEGIKSETMDGSYSCSSLMGDFKTIGPDQHFSKSIVRAIENNTFLLRSANRGVSAIIDNKGNIIKKLNRNEAGNIEFEVPLIKSNKIKNDLIFFVLLITYIFIFILT